MGYGSAQHSLDDVQMQVSPNQKYGYRYQEPYLADDEETEYDALLGINRESFAEYESNSTRNIFEQRYNSTLTICFHTVNNIHCNEITIDYSLILILF